MKIDPSKPPAAPARTEQRPIAEARRSLSGLASSAVAKTIAAHAETPHAKVTHEHPLLEGFGKALGMGLGVIVTEALGVLPGWNKPVLGADGKPLKDIPGATRIGNHDLLKRHEEVVGPKVSALVAKLPPGLVHDLLAGFAEGATAAPGESYRLEAMIADKFEG